MEESAQAKNTLSVPVAIVIAGAFIALAVYFSRTPVPETQNQAAQNNEKPAVQTQSAITIRPIDSLDHTLGNPGSSVALIVYTDIECPFCKTFHTTINQVANTYGKDGKLLIVYRHFPLVQLHPRAPKESEAAECVAEVKGKAAFWDFMNEIFRVTPSNNGLDPTELPKIASRIGITGDILNTFNACLSSGKFEKRVSADYEEAVNAGGRGTPFSVFVLAKPLTESTIQTIESINTNFTQQGASEGPLLVSSDQKRVSMSGALPVAYVQRLVDLFIEN